MGAQEVTYAADLGQMRRSQVSNTAAEVGVGKGAAEFSEGIGASYEGSLGTGADRRLFTPFNPQIIQAV
nr:hypothetical protein [Tanacetum cinerariifolium]